jgi:hypothetical protein
MKTLLTFKLLIITTLMAITVGCGKRESSTMENRETEKAKEQIEQRRTDSSAGQTAEVERALADLDKEIRELEVRVEKTEGEPRREALAKAEALKNRRDELRRDYSQAKFDALMNDVKAEVRSWTK